MIQTLYLTISCLVNRVLSFPSEKWFIQIYLKNTGRIVIVKHLVSWSGRDQQHLWSAFCQKETRLLFKAQILILSKRIHIYKSITASENLFFMSSLRTKDPKILFFPPRIKPSPVPCCIIPYFHLQLSFLQRDFRTYRENLGFLARHEPLLSIACRENQWSILCDS